MNDNKRNFLANSQHEDWHLFSDVSCTVIERNTQKCAYVVDTAAATALTAARCVKSILRGDLVLNRIYRNN